MRTRLERPCASGLCLRKAHECAASRPGLLACSLLKYILQSQTLAVDEISPEKNHLAWMAFQLRRHSGTRPAKAHGYCSTGLFSRVLEQALV